MQITKKSELEIHLLAQCDLALKNAPYKDTFWTPLQKQAYHYFIEKGLPNRKDENYRYTPLIEQLTPLFAKKKLSAPPPSKPTVREIPLPSTLQAIDGYLITFYNGSLLPLQKEREKIPFILLPLQKAYQQFPHLLNEHFYPKLALPQNAFTAINTILCPTPYFLYIPPHVKIDKPIIVHHHSDHTDPTTIHPRLLTLLDRNSSATYIETSSTPTSSSPIFSNQVSDISLLPESKLTSYLWQVGQTIPYQLRYTYLYQEKKSSLAQYTIALSNNSPLLRDQTHLKLTGEKATSTLQGIYINQKAQHLALHTHVHHSAPHTSTTQHYKGIGKATSTTLFDGYIDIEPTGQETVANQYHKSWIVDNKATIHSRPQLAIKADQVQCSHGVTTTQPDPSILFYLQTRGIPYEKAQKMLLEAFFNEEIDSLPHLAIQKSTKQAILPHLTF